MRPSPGTEVVAGELAFDGNAAVFGFDAAFARSGWSLSPMLPPRPGLVRARNPRAFFGLHGIFGDSLPDAWGELLLDRRLRSDGRSIADLTALDRLADVALKGRGALVYLPAHERLDDARELDIDDLARDAREVFDGAAGDVLRELERLGGSSGGARPKVQVWLDENDRARAGAAGPSGSTAWIVKFASRADRFGDIGPLEAAYAETARRAGIVLPRTRLIAAASGPGYFATERFDRAAGGTRAHLLSIAGMLDVDWRFPSIDYETLCDAVRGATRDERAVEQIVRRMIFNVAAINRDDHAKQHSLVFTPRDGWRLSPAYDLTFSNGPGGEHYLAVNGKGRDIAYADIVAVAKRQGIAARRTAELVDEVDAALDALPETATSFGVSKATLANVTGAIAAQRKFARG